MIKPAIKQALIMKAILIYGMAFFLLVSCKSNNLRPDSASISAIDANYPTIEFSIKDTLYHGYAMYPLKPGESLDIKIQGYYEGSLKVDGQCLENKVDRLYGMNEKITISIRPKKSCYIRAVMFPRYDKNKEPVTVFPIVGYIAIKLVDTEQVDWHGEARRVRDGISDLLYFNVGGEGFSDVTIGGCGEVKNFKAEISNGTIELDLLDFNYSKSTCVLEGYATSPIYAPLKFSIFYAKYAASFPELDNPKVVLLKNGKLWIKGSGDVSILSFDNEYYFSNDITVQKFNPNQKHIIRAITAKGRTAIGEWKPERKAVVWVR